MHFYVINAIVYERPYNVLTYDQVEGSSRLGVVNLHLTKRPGQTEFEYKYLTLDVKGELTLRFNIRHAHSRDKATQEYTSRMQTP